MSECVRFMLVIVWSSVSSSGAVSSAILSVGLLFPRVLVFSFQFVLPGVCPVSGICVCNSVRYFYRRVSVLVLVLLCFACD